MSFIHLNYFTLAKVLIGICLTFGLSGCPDSPSDSTTSTSVLDQDLKTPHLDQDISGGSNEIDQSTVLEVDQSIAFEYDADMSLELDIGIMDDLGIPTLIPHRRATGN
jgi:hypothetical protein